jgi:hypothetical protein
LSILESLSKITRESDPDIKTEYFTDPQPTPQRKKPRPKARKSDPSDIPSVEEIDETDIEFKDLTPEEFEEISGLPQKMMSLTVYQLVNKWGGVMSLNKWADFLSKLATISEKEQKMQMRKNELIEKDFVISNLIKFVDLMVNQIIDSAESDVEEIIAMVKTGEENARTRIPEHRRKNITKIARECKKSMADSLKRLKQKYDTDEE